MSLTINLHGLTEVRAEFLIADAGALNCSNLQLSDGNSTVTVFMPYDIAAAMAAAYAAAKTPGYQALLGFAEEVRDCSPDVISGRSRDPQDDVPDMIEADVLWNFQADAETLIGKRQKAVAA